MNNRISEGTESAARLLRLHVVNTMTDDRLNLHRPVVDGQTGLIVGRINTETMEVDDGVSVGGCCQHNCEEGRNCPQRIEYAGDEPSGVDWIAVAAVCIVLAAILVASFSAEIAEVLYRMDAK